jgi:hypothetical protein
MSIKLTKQQAKKLYKDGEKTTKELHVDGIDDLVLVMVADEYDRVKKEDTVYFSVVYYQPTTGKYFFQNIERTAVTDVLHKHTYGTVLYEAEKFTQDYWLPATAA